MKQEATIVGLWDYGWLMHDSVDLPASPSDAALIQAYVASPAFHTSFVQSDNDESGIHGPFHADRIGLADFVPMEEVDLRPYLDTVELSANQEEDKPERAKALALLSTAFQEGSRCYVLKVDERNKDLLHDWGFVLTLFREFLFIGHDRRRLERFIIGYD